MLALRSARTLLTKSPLQSVPSFALRYNSTNNETVLQHFKKDASSSLQSILAAPNIKKPNRKIIDESDVLGAKEVAKNIPVTGPIAGRMVKVENGDIDRAFKIMRTVINTNHVKFDKQQQRYYKKPGKVLEEKRIRRKKRLFDEGVRRLMNIVKEAKRRGY